MSFIMRTTKPEAGNKYYIRKASGGYSDAIKGYPTDPDCDVLPNCVGYAYGRFNEIGGYGYCKYLFPDNAENFMQYKGSCEVGQVPKVGACMVWQKGATLKGSDGAGHVAIVEKVISETEVYTSESGYGSAAFWNQIRRKGADGRWGAGAQYTFLGFIYNPAVCEEPTADTTQSSCKGTVFVGDTVRIAEGAVYYNMTKIVPEWVRNKTWIVSRVEGDCVVIDRSADGKNAIRSPIHVKYLTVLSQNHQETSPVFEPYLAKVKASVLNIRKGAGTNYPVVGCIRDQGIYTIVGEENGAGATKWGKLKSGAGWISLDYVQKMG